MVIKWSSVIERTTVGDIFREIVGFREQRPVDIIFGEQVFYPVDVIKTKDWLSNEVVLLMYESEEGCRQEGKTPLDFMQLKRLCKLVEEEKSYICIGNVICQFYSICNYSDMHVSEIINEEYHLCVTEDYYDSEKNEIVSSFLDDLDL